MKSILCKQYYAQAKACLLLFFGLYLTSHPGNANTASGVEPSIISSKSSAYIILPGLKTSLLKGLPSAAKKTVAIKIEVNNAPVLKPLSNKKINEGSKLSFRVYATDLDVDQTLSFSLVDAPAGATIDPATGVFTWIPTEEQGGASYTFRVRVTDSGSPALSDEKSQTVTVVDVNAFPVLQAISSRSTTCGNSISFKAIATDPDIPKNTLTFSLSGTVPAGANINPQTGDFTWTPMASQLGSHKFTIRVTDNGVPVRFRERSFTLTLKDTQVPVAQAKNITVELDRNGAAVVLPEQINNNSTDNCSIASLSLDKTSFSCANLGANAVLLTVKDGAGNSKTAKAIVTVVDKLAPLAIAKEHTIYLDANGNATLSIADVNNNSSDNCTQAAALKINLDKTSFSCADKGLNNVVLSVEDAFGYVATATASINVIDNAAPVITACPVNRRVEIRANQPYTMPDFRSELLATDNCAVSSITQLPAPGTIIDQAVIQPISFLVKDAAGNETGCTFEVQVLYINTAPTALNLSANSIQEHQPAGTYIGTFSTQDPDAGDQHTFQLVAGAGSEDNASFYLQGNDLYSQQYFDFEMNASLSIRVATVDQEGGALEKVLTIEVLDIADVRAYLPNLYSPNKDSRNDAFRLRANGLQQVSFRVFNRMGELVYQTADVLEATERGWDGTFKGKDVPSGTYVWQISGRFSDGTELTVNGKNTGNVTLIR